MAKKVVLNVDLIYPIGSIYMSVNSTNPKKLFGGTWVQLKDRFLLGAGSTYTNGKTGGEATHTLTAGELPKTSGDGQFRPYDSFSASGIVKGKSWNESKNFSAASGVQTASTVYGFEITFGNDEPHNNMPPYLVVYMWKRTA